MAYRRHVVIEPQGIRPKIAVYVLDSLSAEQANQLVREATLKGPASSTATLEKPFQAYLGTADDNGYSLLPAASEKYAGATHAVEFAHPYYGRVRATYHCHTYELDQDSLYFWSLESAVPLGPNAPRPKPLQNYNPGALGIGAREKDKPA